MLRKGLVRREIDMYLEYKEYMKNKEQEKSKTNGKRLSKFNIIRQATFKQDMISLKDFEYIENLILKKVEITKVIYLLIQSICKDNPVN